MTSENDYKAFVDDYLNTRDRLIVVETKVERILELIEGISKDLSGGRDIAEKIQTGPRAPNRTTGRTNKRNANTNSK